MRGRINRKCQIAFYGVLRNVFGVHWHVQQRAGGVQSDVCVD